MLRSIKLIISVLCTVVILAYFGCGGSKTSTDNLVEPNRTGTEFESTGLEYYEGNPLLNNAGDKAVFTSGKLAEGETVKVLKIYKVDWTASSAPSTPVRATDSDATLFEKEAVLSQNGDYIAIIGSKENQIDLYLQDYAGSNDLIQVTNDAAVESSVSFVSDGASAKMISYVSTDSSGSTTLVVIDIGDGSSSAMADANKKTVEGEALTDAFFLSSTSSPYTLVTGALDTVTMQKSFSTRALTTATDVTTAQKQEWFTNFAHFDGVSTSANTQMVAFTKRVLPAGTKKTTRAGDLEEETPREIDVKVEPSFVSVADATESSFASPVGFTVLSLGLTSDGANALWVVQQGYHCAKEGSAFSYASGMVFGKTDGSSSAWIIPRASADEAVEWEAATSFCDTTRSDETEGVLDTKITGAVINGDSTTNSYRVIYTSRYTTAVDEDGALKAGDPELWALDFDGTTTTIYPLFSNQATID